MPSACVAGACAGERRREAQHPDNLGRRHRPVQRQRLQQRHDGLPHAQHRPDRRGRRALHRLVRPAVLHRRSRRLHHRPVADPHRPDQGRPARRARGHEGRGPDHRRPPQAARLRHRPVRQEPPRRPRRDAADQQRLRAVLRQPLPPQRRGGAGEPRLSDRSGVQGAVRSAWGDPVVRQRRWHTGHRGHRSADPETHGNGRRRGHRRGARLHGQGACGRKAVLRVVELHPHARLHPSQAGIGGGDRPRDLRRRHGRARRPGRPAARQARRARHRREHHRDVLDRQRRRDLHLARRRHHDVPRREEHQLGGRLPRAERSSAGPA